MDIVIRCMRKSKNKYDGTIKDLPHCDVHIRNLKNKE